MIYFIYAYIYYTDYHIFNPYLNGNSLSFNDRRLPYICTYLNNQKFVYKYKTKSVW